MSLPVVYERNVAKAVFHDLNHQRKTLAAGSFDDSVLLHRPHFKTGDVDIFERINSFENLQAAMLENLHLDKISKGHFFKDRVYFRHIDTRCASAVVPYTSYADKSGNLKNQF